MNLIKDEVIEQAREFVSKELGSETSGHDWWHIKRVSQMARRIAMEEGADPGICELAALLHDIPDDKRGISEEEGLSVLMDWMDSHGIAADSKEHILQIISTMSFRGGNNPPMNTIEGKVVQDADRLDAIGAIGIARAFLYSGHTGQAIYDPEIPVRMTMTKEEYRNGKSTAINHFHEKLLKLFKSMNTSYARQVAIKRQKFMEDFLGQFYLEWNGQD